MSGRKRDDRGGGSEIGKKGREKGEEKLVRK